MRTLESGGALSEMDLITARRNVAFTAKLALKAGTRLFNAAGGRALFRRQALERQYRNLLGAASHHAVVGTPTPRPTASCCSANTDFEAPMKPFRPSLTS